MNNDFYDRIELFSVGCTDASAVPRSSAHCRDSDDSSESGCDLSISHCDPWGYPVVGERREWFGMGCQGAAVSFLTMGRCQLMAFDCFWLFLFHGSRARDKQGKSWLIKINLWQLLFNQSSSAYHSWTAWDSHFQGL